MSRHGSIFYDAPEALNALFLDENKDELGKMVGWKKENDKEGGGEPIRFSLLS